MNKFEKKLAFFFQDVEGLIGFEEAKLLYDLAKDCKENCIVEIGNLEGCSTISLAFGSKDGNDVQVYTIDPHEKWSPVDFDKSYDWRSRRELFKNLLNAEVIDVVRPIETKSQIIAPGWNKKISLLFIDGNHSFEDCKHDIEMWVPHLVDGGKLVLHDYNHEDFEAPEKYGDKLINDFGYKVVDQVGLSIVLEKSE